MSTDPDTRWSSRRKQAKESVESLGRPVFVAAPPATSSRYSGFGDSGGVPKRIHVAQHFGPDEIRVDTDLDPSPSDDWSVRQLFHDHCSRLRGRYGQRLEFPLRLEMQKTSVRLATLSGEVDVDVVSSDLVWIATGWIGPRYVQIQAPAAVAVRDLKIVDGYDEVLASCMTQNSSFR
jgi:hypothetical protein